MPFFIRSKSTHGEEGAPGVENRADLADQLRGASVGGNLLQQRRAYAECVQSARSPGRDDLVAQRVELIGNRNM
ncbi:hypothetical protein [Mycolicibacterium sarraceniae]|uniref:Uncharacterized protein n=1 Tax=Mycolicibacterium sarraceniae TaxID=1534348 RepID=A0A7I7SVI0_9MYCO|nr:hypothetical protein [Mycolicibacterium sarraceniae]BBY60620.1 hypothetical protein MSAR_37560 [Mycolicibacterium sarraceniae]